MSLSALVIMASGAVFAEDTDTKEQPAEEQKLPEGMEQFKDWIKECEMVKGPEDKEVELCQISQTLTNKELDKPMLKVAVGYVPGKEEAVMVITLPLGIILPPGIQLTILKGKEKDEGKAAQMPVTSCLPAGCQAGVQLDKEFTARLKKGSRLVVTFLGPDGKQVNAPVSLSGFTAGLESMKKP
ncbi:MAG: invasion associated locus B family protein [Pseudomonadota bacterium]